MPFNPVSYRGPSGDPSSPEAAALVSAYRARFSPKPPIVGLYTDGGVIRVNPSPIGGTWAWCMVDACGERVRHAYGRITPQECDVDVVTNNVTELLALVLGLEALPDGWTGTVWGDSWVSLQRVFLAAALHNVPQWLVERLWAIQKSGKLARMSYQLLDGHPTKAQLESGIGKRGNPVSVHNVYVDQLCSQVAREVSAE